MPARSRSRSRSARPAHRRPAADALAAPPAKGRDGVVRYAVVGLGYFAQAAVLPAFSKAKRSRLAALVSDDATKLRELGETYGVALRLGYEAYDDLCASGNIDAVYLCLPNDLHADFAVRAAERGIHVLCEKPLAVTVAECQRMIDSCEDAGVRLMTAYRLHFNDANLDAVQAIQDGEIGTPRFFVSAFSSQVKPGIRTRGEDRGGGPLHDIGIYCINAARYLFKDEPQWVQASAATGERQARFRRIDEQVACTLGFPKGRLATFTASYGAADTASYQVYGTSGCLDLASAYEWRAMMRLEVEGPKGRRAKRYRKRDQVAPEIAEFSACVLEGRDPEPSGREGLIDVAIIEALRRSAETGRRVPLRVPSRRRRPTPAQAMPMRGHRMPGLVNADVPFR